MCTMQTYANSALQSINPLVILQRRFSHFATTQKVAPELWYQKFQADVYYLLAGFGLSGNEVEYLLRSGEFVSFACDLLGNPQPQHPFTLI
jgi:hypothetical protein